MSNLEKWIRAIMQEDRDKLSIESIRTLQMIKHEFEAREKEIAEWREECERLAGLVEFWQNKYYELNPPHQPLKLDNL